MGRLVGRALAVGVSTLVCIGAAVSPAAADAPLEWTGGLLVDQKPPFDANKIRSVSCPSTTFCAAVDDTGSVTSSSNPTNGSSWSRQLVANFRDFRGISCPSASLCFAIDTGGRVFYSTTPSGGAAQWSQTPPVPANGPNAISCPSAALCVTVDNQGNVIASSTPTNGSSWTTAKIDSSVPILSVDCASESLCVATDYFGNVLTSTNPTGGAAAWHGAHIDGTTPIRGVSCPSTGLCVAVDDDGNVLTSTNPTGGVGAWSSTPVNSGNALVGVSCASASLCVAVGGPGKTVTSTNPTGGILAWHGATIAGMSALTSVSCPATTLCVVVDDHGREAASADPGAATPTWNVASVAGTNDLEAVSCPSSSLCVAVDDAGNAVTSTNPTGGFSAWREDHVYDGSFGSSGFGGLSCPSEDLCVAVAGTDAITSTDPAGGAPWSPSAIDPGHFLTDVSCPSESFCVAVDLNARVLTSTNPTGGPAAWTATQLVPPSGPARLLAVDCPTSSLCIAVYENYIWTSTDPSGGASKWTPLEIPASDVSCASPSFCVASAGGSVVTSTDPTAGTFAWTRTTLNEGGIGPIDCPSTSLCVGTSGSGHAFTSTNPTGGANAWTRTPIDAQVALRDVSCPSTSLCVAVDEVGAVDVGTPKPPKTLTVSRAGNGTGTVASSPAGIDCGATCSHAYADSTDVTLTATPSADSNFNGWSGACTGTGSCHVTMDQARSVTATFVKKTFPLTVSKLGGGSGKVTSTPAGINCGADCSQTYEIGTGVALHAAPAAGSKFKTWGGACSGAGACNVTMSQARSVTATFVKVVTKGATLAKSTVTATKGGDVTLRIGNPNNLGVQGDVKLRMGVRKGGQPTTVQIGHSTFAVPANGSTNVKVHLSDRARNRLKNRGQIRAFSTIVIAANGTSKTTHPAITIKAPPAAAATAR
jgi:hypothetical protein